MMLGTALVTSEGAALYLYGKRRDQGGGMKPTIFDLDTYICSKLPSRPGAVARHKLAYGVFRYSIIKTGEPIVDAFVAALPLGPCFVSLLEHPNRTGDPNALSADEKRMTDEVLQKLGAMSGRALAARSHRNYYEWRMMREGMHDNQVKSCGHYREIKVSTIRLLPQIQKQGSNVGYPLL